MAALDTGPCETWPALCTDFPDSPSSDEEDLINAALESATEVLWNRTKRRFGQCEVTLRPCRRECWPQWNTFLSWLNVTGWSWPFPALIGGTWVNLACGQCPDGHCSCTAVSETILPYPVASITQVLIDGVVLDPSAYRVDNHRLLVRVDGMDWPRCNDLSKADTEPGTWSVTARYGEVIPTLGEMAVGQLATHIFKSCVGDAGCALPGATVRQVQRQGVTKVFFDGDSAFKGGRVGLYYPDLFVSTYNPSGTGRAHIFDIDGPRRRYAGT